MYRISDSDKLPNSFAVSMYSDGSIRMSYIQIESLVEFGEFNGLWGAIASQSNYYLRYHSENISSSAVASGNSVMYCPSSSIACIPNSCVAAGEALVIHWTAPETCAAVGSDLSFKCLWSGLIETNASYFSGQVTCTVPPINISSGSITFVHLVTTFENDDGEIIYLSSFHEAGSNAEIPSYGQKDVYGVYIGGNEELSRSNLIVRYYDMSDKKPSNCGCGGLDNILSSSCDAQNVCGGNNTNGDCFGTAFGSAYIDACDVCSGGLTGIAPNSLCSSSSGNDYINLISQTIILLMIICCMTFITSSVSYSIRRLLANRSQNNTADPGFVLQLMEARGASARGLSEFECEALGQIIFSKEFYEQHQLEVARAASKNKGIDGSFSIIDFSSKEKSNEDRNTTCDCPICLMEIQDGSVCRVLPEPCMHLFHQECIDEWFHQSTMCPLCKRSIKSILDGTYEEETQPESIARSQSVSSLRHVDEDIQDVEMVGDGTNQHNTGSVRFSLRSAFMNSINQNGGDFRQILPQNEEVRAGGPRRFTAAQISSSTDSSTDLFGATSRISFAPADTSESQADQREGHENV